MSGPRVGVLGFRVGILGVLVVEFGEWGWDGGSG